MNKFFTLLSASLFIITLSGIQSSSCFSQQDPMYTQYMFNKMVFNPAYVGNNRQYIDLTFLYHNQWLGFGTNKYIDPRYKDYVAKPPQTQTFSLSAPIPKSNFGAGLYVIDDIEGFNNMINFCLAASYRIEFNSGVLQLGLSGGMIENSINGKWLPPQPTPDPVLPNGPDMSMRPDLNAGVYFFSTRYYLGVSADHLLRPQFNFTTSNAGFYTIERIYFVNAGYNFMLPNRPDFVLEPSTLIKIDPGKLQFELNCNATYKEKFWGGLSVKQGWTPSLLIGMKITDNLKAGYSYDYTANQLRKTSSGTHEVMLNYIFKIKITTHYKPPIIIWTPRFL